MLVVHILFWKNWVMLRGILWLSPSFIAQQLSQLKVPLKVTASL